MSRRDVPLSDRKLANIQKRSMQLPKDCVAEEIKFLQDDDMNTVVLSRKGWAPHVLTSNNGLTNIWTMDAIAHARQDVETLIHEIKRLKSLDVDERQAEQIEEARRTGERMGFRQAVQDIQHQSTVIMNKRHEQEQENA